MATQQDTRLLTGGLNWIEADGPDEQKVEVGGTWLRVTGACPDLRGQDVTILYQEDGPALIALRIEGRGEDGEHRVLWKRGQADAARHRPEADREGGRRR